MKTQAGWRLSSLKTPLSAIQRSNACREFAGTERNGRLGRSRSQVSTGHLLCAARPSNPFPVKKTSAAPAAPPLLFGRSEGIRFARLRALGRSRSQVSTGHLLCAARPSNPFPVKKQAQRLRHHSCFLVGVKGFEPPTSCSQSRRATNCATPRHIQLLLLYYKKETTCCQVAKPRSSKRERNAKQ